MSCVKKKKLNKKLCVAVSASRSTEITLVEL